ncbi:hypothetical protein LZ32DRAFT_601989 [Colletotrichum eremochloae]|nr:hypothetical protein LZ32DRAFT_601989 [Colletotrichum eremochloae]
MKISVPAAALGAFPRVFLLLPSGTPSRPQTVAFNVRPSSLDRALSPVLARLFVHSCFPPFGRQGAFLLDDVRIDVTLPS